MLCIGHLLMLHSKSSSSSKVIVAYPALSLRFESMKHAWISFSRTVRNSAESPFTFRSKSWSR